MACNNPKCKTPTAPAATTVLVTKIINVRKTVIVLPSAIAKTTATATTNINAVTNAAANNALIRRRKV